MKKVTINRLALSNFKGIRALELEFSGGVTTVSGRNGTGKTTVKDAFSWLLWGKDAGGNADTKFGIKTVDANGDFIPGLEHGVTGAFTVADDETGEVRDVTLRRVLVEDWDTRRGEALRVLKGHHTEFSVNGVPLATKREYDQRVAEIIPEEVFKTITDPGAFLAMKWQAQREMLLTVAGEVKDREVAGDNAAFNDLLSRLTGKTLEDYRRELGAKWKAITAELEKIPTRIDEAHRAISMIIKPDYAALEAEKGRIEAEARALDEANADLAKANRLAFEAAADVERRKAALKAAQQEMVYKAEAAGQSERHKAEQLLRKAEADFAASNSAITDAEAAMAAKRRHLGGQAAYYEEEADRMAAETAELRHKWSGRNAESYQPGCMACPRFGHVCRDPEAATKGEAEFYAALAADLAAISERGKRLNAMAAEARSQADAARQALKEEEAAHGLKLEALKAKSAEAQRVLYGLMHAHDGEGQTSTDPKAAPEYLRLQAEIDALEREGRRSPAGHGAAAAESNNRRRAQLGQRLEEIARQLGFREVIATQRDRIKELNAQAAKLAAERAEVEGTVATADEFTKRRMAEVERRVNALFPTLRFKMYSDQINGEQRPDCVASVGGVRYIDLNTAKKTNAGLEAINVLSAFHGCTAPIFIDNAESVNELTKTSGQLIRLVVNEAEGLTVEKQ